MSQQHRKALIIEDDRKQWSCYERPMREEGWECKFVLGGKDAIEALSESRYDLILLDLGLNEPGYLNSLDRGKEVFHQIREKTDTPILMITVHADKHPGETIIQQLKPDYCISKPFTPDDLWLALDKLGLI